MDKVLEIGPDITIDDGADLIFKLHTERQDLLPNILEDARKPLQAYTG